MAVIVDGSGQIGRAIVEHFIRERCRVAIVSRGRTDMAFLVTWDQEKTERTMRYPADIGNESEIKDCLDRIKTDLKQIDFLIYAPGQPPDTDLRLANCSTAKWEKTFEV